MKVLIIAGSNRANATSTKLARCVAGKLRGLGAEAECWELYARPVPFYDPNYEPGSRPEDANLSDLLRLAEESDALGFSTPEYHGAPTGLMKNALDWIEKKHAAGKAVLSMATAGGAVAISTLQQLQAIVRYVHGVNCPEWISLGKDLRSFSPEGEPLHPDAVKRISHVTEYFYHFALRQANMRNG